MTAITSAADGNWSDTGTWTGGVVPGDGDTVTLSHNVTITANVTVGSSPSTGGTAAIAFGSVDAKTLTVNAGIELRLKGDFQMDSSYSGRNTLSVGAGGSVVFHPPSGQRYRWKRMSNSKFRILFNGTAESRCAIYTDKTDGGLNFTTTGAGNFATAFSCTLDYTDVTDGGSTTEWAIRLFPSNHASKAAPIHIRNCVFTRASLYLQTNSSAGGNFEITNNTFTDSTTLTGLSSIIFDFVSSGANTLTISGNSFDKSVRFQPFTDLVRFTRNVLPLISFDATSTWTNEDYFADNLILMTGGETVIGGGATGTGVKAGIKRVYFFNEGLGLAHSMAILADNAVMVDCVGENLNTSGDATLFSAAHDHPQTFTGNIAILPGGGNLMVCVEHPGPDGKITLEHNTVVGGHLSRVGQGSPSYPSFEELLLSCRSNLVVHEDTPGSVFVAHDDTAAGAGAVDAVKLSTHNAVLNGDTGTCYYNNGATSQADVVGYDALKILPNEAFPNSQVGDSDVTLSTNPFFDSTRNLATYGSEVAGTDGSIAQAKTWCFANPLAATAADTGVLDWVRAGFRVTGAEAESLLKDAGHDSVTIGAMPYEASEPDVTAPILSSATANVTGATTATVGCTTDEADGTLYGVVTTSSTAPSKAQVKAGQDHTGSAAVFADDQAIASTGAKTFDATGLTAETGYYAHFMHEDSDGNQSDVLTGALFTTDETPATQITITGPSTIVKDVPRNYTYTPDGDADGIEVTPTTDGTGTFDPASDTFSGSTPLVFAYTATDHADSPHTLGSTDDGTLTNGTKEVTVLEEAPVGSVAATLIAIGVI